MKRVNLCDFCKSKTASGKCACMPDFVRPTGLYVNTCNYFTMYNSDWCDVEIIIKNDFIVGLCATTSKRCRNKNLITQQL